MYVFLPQQFIFKFLTSASGGYGILHSMQALFDKNGMRDMRYFPEFYFDAHLLQLPLAG
jgi:hypothetical protein